jgi:DNA-binding MarR family transcriptional regulator
MAVMRYPGPEDQRPSEVAVETGMSKQATNYLLGQLERLGYLTRDEDPDDQRSKRIHLTARGRAAAQCIRATVGRIETELEQELGPKRLARLRRLLIRLNATETISDQRR